MSDMSDFYEKASGDHVLRNIAYVSPITIFLALFTTDPLDDQSGTEVPTAGTAYARQAITFGAPTVPPSGTVYATNADVNFPIATADYGSPVTHAGITDSSAAGAPNLLFHAQLTSPKTIEQDDQFVVRTGDGTVEFQ